MPSESRQNQVATQSRSTRTPSTNRTARRNAESHAELCTKQSLLPEFTFTQVLALRADLSRAFHIEPNPRFHVPVSKLYGSHAPYHLLALKDNSHFFMGGQTHTALRPLQTLSPEAEASAPQTLEPRPEALSQGA